MKIDRKIVQKASMLLTGTTVFFLGATGSVKAFDITPTSNGETLVDNILGEGITVVPGSVSYTGAECASGTFTGGAASGIGIESGILLTTGCATDAAGPNTSDATTTSNGFFGDSDLNALIPGYMTYDATILEFDFESEGGDLFFNYVFASEEYNEYVNSSFNDVFGFFLNGVNIALIPGTDTPVAINTVNNGNPFGGINASNPELYNNNDFSDGGGSYNIEYDGFTNVFTAKFLDLTPGTHTIKLAIADAGDPFLDSGVFIQANSFSDKKGVPEPTSVFGLLAVGALGATAFKGKQKTAR
ncbi:choice-of-anchor L family PEP-CTERM protein [Lyngbya sp. CCY1209]|uniref:choice-of-anchor L family PEP-CTERM protein n=1 Tax=Lyngbya sp. CCY1209 TaxID=2886103 RepID=UPI002D2110B2|nr:choice-of-anchor L domain-containing protein [Lyngbya sp. CCY1209]MEB3885741.1 choice-of-anchor L domain-containing protein [Lyngbya sp. CCY1209]